MGHGSHDGGKERCKDTDIRERGRDIYRVQIHIHTHTYIYMYVYRYRYIVLQKRL